MGIRGGKAGSVKKLKASMKKGSGGGDLWRVKADAPLIVRFLEEPDEWYEFFSHFDPAKKRAYVCPGDDCDYCADDMRAAKRCAASVVVVDDGKVVLLEMPASLVNRMLKWYDKYDTVLDRDYELTRTGAGKDDTEYDAMAEPPKRMRLDRFDPIDPEPVLLKMLPGAEDEDDDEEDDDKPRPRVRTTRQKLEDEDPPFETDDDDEEEDDRKFGRATARRKVKPAAAPTTSRTRTAGKTLPTKRALPKSSGGLSKVPPRKSPLSKR